MENQVESGINTDNQGLAVKLQSLIDNAAKQWDDARKRVKRARYYTEGYKIHGDGTVNTESDYQSPMVRANLIYSTMQGLLPYVYAKAPEISVKPSESVQEIRYQWLKPFCKTLEIVIQRHLHDAKIKQRGKQSVRGSMTSKVGWVKVTYQRNYQEDPIIRARIEDAQDNIARVEKTIMELQDEQNSNDHLVAKRQLLTQQIAALEKQVEVVAGEGMTMDYCRFEDIICDPTILCFEDYPIGRFIDQRIWMAKDEACERLKHKLEHATLYQNNNKDEAENQPRQAGGGDTQTKDPLVLIDELWFKSSMTVFTLVKGLKEFPKEPYQPERLGERWYPFFGLALYPLDANPVPNGLSEQLEELQDEYNTTRTQLAEHRELSIPHWIADKQIEEDDIIRKRDAVLGEVVIVDAKGRPLSEVFTDARPPALNPAVYDTTAIRTDFDLVSGLPDANRGNIMRSKTLGEAQIMQGGLQGRTEENRDTVEDWLSDIAQYSGEILLQELTVEQVLRLAGPGAMWPQLTKDELFDMVEVTIRAGSTGRPNRQLEQETWVKLLPEIRNTVMQIWQTTMQGLDPTPMIALLKETVSRFDERIDVERFLPNTSPTMSPGVGMPSAAVPGAQGGAPVTPPAAGGNVVPFTGAGGAR